MYLELLDEKQKNKNKAKKKKAMIMSRKSTKKIERNVRSTWLDHMASEGIQ